MSQADLMVPKTHHSQADTAPTLRRLEKLHIPRRHPRASHQPRHAGTLAALVGTKVPADQAQDSLNLLPLLTGKGTFTQRPWMIQQAGSKKNESPKCASITSRT
ncbi:hypothetical protein N9224_00490 [Akkermansiaceae bacterium]|nr:hypothetical protein [Akkermansiaceae bacterium]